MTTPLFDTTVELVGEDGNALAIMAKVKRAIKNAGGTDEDVDAFIEEATSGDYDNLFRTAMKYVNVA